MEICHIKPSKYLSNYIAGYATVTINNRTDFPFNGSALPDGFVEIYFSKYGSLSLKSSGQYESNNLHTGFLIGQSNKKIQMLPNEALEFFQVKVFPWAAKYFIYDSANIYSNKVTFISDLNNKNLSNLEQRMLNCNSTKERINIIESYLVESIKQKKDYSKRLYLACDFIFRTKGTMQIKTLADKLSISTQYLERIFKEHVGLSPKQFSSVIRMRSLVHVQKKQPYISLTQLALQFNYFDQSHFIHDFNSFMEETPASFFKKDDNFVLEYFPFTT
ncbi:helix-turn-helix domain-containing protein [uncultured Psychroserpens sp.]|uniref:helix-turn-helix domain-containing protein n=1 Tax=uncultured Psychroserpens sp. TaxID=255436 RepID=UPI0026320A75|nr:helix-turn-helix domain-containing protein [uncultured Psychroserpens sp.]